MRFFGNNLSQNRVKHRSTTYGIVKLFPILFNAYYDKLVTTRYERLPYEDSSLTLLRITIYYQHCYEGFINEINKFVMQM